VPVYSFDPLKDPRWDSFIAQHPDATVFHTSAWLRVLYRTYGYEPIVFTTSRPGADLLNALVFCRVTSWLTGNRLVSLPFSDHCDPLVEDGRQLEELGHYLEGQRRAKAWSYVEIRSRRTPPVGTQFATSQRFCLHLLDLRPGPEALFRNFHRDCTQRKIRRAAREALTYEEGRSDELLRAFHVLMVETRRRHGVPAPPLAWFRNLAECLGGAMTVRLARYHGRPAAGLVTLRHRQTAVYKYGASKAVCHKAGGMHLLFWRTIQDSHAGGCLELDLGRSHVDSHGLLLFKDRWGAARSDLLYWRHPAGRATEWPVASWLSAHAMNALRWAPRRVVAAAGDILYKHAG
jgi:lipid II:glycine glycyltransferase (peptidoglycan interpeptide bridge formation enzyme)